MRRRRCGQRPPARYPPTADADWIPRVRGHPRHPCHLSLLMSSKSVALRNRRGGGLMGRERLQRYEKERIRVSEREKICFVRREGESSSCGARGDEGWEQAHHRGSYLGQGDKRELWDWGHKCCGGGQLGSGARSWALHAFPLLLLSCPLKVRIEMAIGREDSREIRF